jgi:hypothetical protein
MFFISQAQVKIGSNPTTAVTNTNLAVEATNGNTTVVTKDLGRVGIGVTAPDNQLHVKATANPIKLEGLQMGSPATDEIVVTDGSGVIKRIGNLDAALAAVSVPKPALFELYTNQTDFLNGVVAGELQVVFMDLIKNSIPGLTYNSFTRTITFPAGTYQMTFVYEAEHNNTGCTLSSYFVDFPFQSGVSAKRIHNTSSHTEGSLSNHGGTVSFTTQLPAGKTYQIRLGRGQSGNCSGTGMTLIKESTQFVIFRIGD